MQSSNERATIRWLQALMTVLLGALLLAGTGARAATETITHLHTDISGSPLAATDASGAVLWKESYRAYGSRWLNEPGSETQTQWFHGKEQDTATGLQYFGARYYDPAVGRFLGVDPVDFQEGNLHSFNRYAYGNNNPVRYTDPDGRIAVPLIYLGGAALATASVALLPPEQRNQMMQPILRAVQGVGDALGSARQWVFNEAADTPKGESDTAVGGLIEGLSNEKDLKNRPTKGQYVKPNGSAQDDLNSLPGEMGDNGQKTLPDGSVAGIHTSTTTGLDTLHIHRPSGSRDIKIRYPKGDEP